MELHHSKHHTTYVNSFNNFSEQAASLSSNTPSDIQAQIALQPLINFHGGGHINHTLFWENLAPKNQGGGEPPSGALGEKIKETFGGLEELKKVMNAKLAGIQGSGWAWLVKDKETGGVGVRTYAVSMHDVVGSEIWWVSADVGGIEPRSGGWAIRTAVGDRCVGACLLVSHPLFMVSGVQ